MKFAEESEKERNFGRMKIRQKGGPREGSIGEEGGPAERGLAEGTPGVLPKARGVPEKAQQSLTTPRAAVSKNAPRGPGKSPQGVPENDQPESRRAREPETVLGACSFLNRTPRHLPQSSHHRQYSANHCRPSISLSHCSAVSDLDFSLRLRTPERNPHDRAIHSIVPLEWPRPVMSVFHPVALPIITPLSRPILFNIRNGSRPTSR